LASWAAFLAGPNEAVGAPGRLFAPSRARAVPRAGVAAQAWPDASGHAGPGPLATGPCRAHAGPKRRDTGRAGGPRAAWPTLHVPCCSCTMTSGWPYYLARYKIIVIRVA